MEENGMFTRGHGSKRQVLVLAGLAVVVLLIIVFARPVAHLLTTYSGDRDQRESLPAGFVDDASRLNKTKVAEVHRLDVDAEDPEGQLVALLEAARSRGQRVSIAGARHSMGGHTISPGGIALDMASWDEMSFDEERGLLTVQSGATWDAVIKFLDPLGRSVQIMQSNDSFTVGGSISVNCHGWQYDCPPIASSVESFRMMLANGSILQCSRTENQELFSLALGGYGLFGIILDVELHVAMNDALRLEQHLVPVGDALATFDEKVKDRPDLELVFARMNIVPETFLEEVILNAFIHDPESAVPKLVDPERSELLYEMIRGSTRTVFRGSAESDYGKGLRWNAETVLTPLLEGKVFSRNQLLDEGVETLENRSAGTTDILHEYFVPRDKAGAFVDAMREIIAGHEGNLLNVTIRGVNEDTVTFLRYADQSMIAFVLLFLQERTADGERKMAEMTRELIDASFANEGTYYLPYRLHATVAQFHRGYPQGRAFFERKREYDPDELFQNEFYLKYGGAAPRPGTTGQ
jgi:FAD/FMN-containing dehydrogenase